jgi:hypothetical protein
MTGLRRPLGFVLDSPVSQKVKTHYPRQRVCRA